MAWFPYITREEDYTSNPSNSICSNEYVCVREENASVSVTKRRNGECAVSVGSLSSSRKNDVR